jgi:hypothetical protein
MVPYRVSISVHFSKQQLNWLFVGLAIVCLMDDAEKQNNKETESIHRTPRPDPVPRERIVLWLEVHKTIHPNGNARSNGAPS